MRRFQCEECDALFLDNGGARADTTNSNSRNSTNKRCPFCGSEAVSEYTGTFNSASASSASSASSSNAERRTSSRIRRRPVESDSDSESENEDDSRTENNETHSNENEEHQTSESSSSASSAAANGIRDSDGADSSTGRRVRLRISTVLSASQTDFAAHIFNLVQANLNNSSPVLTSTERPFSEVRFATFTINLLDGDSMGSLDGLLNAILGDLMAGAGAANQPQGLDEDKIGSLPSTTPDEMHKDCAICREDFKLEPVAEGDEKEDLAQLPACGHAFHRECIGSWLKKVATCPICRKSVE